MGVTPPLDEPKRRMTLEEWAALPEDEPGELVDGVLVEEEMPDAAHEVVVAWLVSALSSWLRPRRGLVLASGLKFAVGPSRGRMADVSCWVPGRARLPRHGAVRVPPDVAIEVTSPGASDVRRDRIEKQADYAAFGVASYWLIDPSERTLEVFTLGLDRRYALTLSASAGRIEAVPGCEGLVLDLDALWAEVDAFVDAGGDR